VQPLTGLYHPQTSYIQIYVEINLYKTVCKTTQPYAGYVTYLPTACTQIRTGLTIDLKQNHYFTWNYRLPPPVNSFILNVAHSNNCTNARAHPRSGQGSSRKWQTTHVR